MAADVDERDMQFRMLCVELDEEITAEEFKKLKYLSKSFELGKGKLEQMTSTLDLLEELEMQEIVKSDNLSKLIDYLLLAIKRNDLRKKVEDFGKI